MRATPFECYSRDIPETLTKAGAQMLAQRIETYWHARGHRVALRLEYFIAYSQHGYGIRSDMLNGLPRA